MFLKRKEFDAFKDELFDNFKKINESNTVIIQNSEQISNQIITISNDLVAFGKCLQKHDETLSLYLKDIDMNFSKKTESLIKESDEIKRSFLQLYEGVNQLMIQNLLDKTELGLKNMKESIKKTRTKDVCCVCGFEIKNNEKSCPYCGNQLS